MPIIHIKGPKKSGKSLLANSLRNSSIGQGKGALLVDDTQDGDPRHLLEKIIVAVPLTEPTSADKIPWKPDPVIVLVGDKISVLEDFEALAPGFLKKFGPVRVMALEAAA